MNGRGPARGRDDVPTVGAVTRQLKSTLEGRFPNLWVQGQISDIRPNPRSGHVYFTLKDDDARLPAMMFASDAQMVRTPPAEGDHVFASGRISVYPPRGAYQMVVQRIFSAGVGELEERFRQMQEKLRAEGLFDHARKRRPPMLPRRVGVVTSGSGAARRDIEAVLHRRAPQIPIVLYPAVVQGERAAADVSNGLRRLAQIPGIDVIIVGRGGGSLEDLWAFNEEVVARAIAASPVPVISAVGHETDTTIADLVADLRAPTPSAAAEAAVPVRDDLLLDLEHRMTRLQRALQLGMERRLGALQHGEMRLQAALRFDQRRRALADLRHRLAEQHPRARVLRARRTLDQYVARLTPEGPRQVEQGRNALSQAAARLSALSPLAVLDRGYSIARDANGHVLKDAHAVEIGTEVEVLLRAGALWATVARVEEREGDADE